MNKQKIINIDLCRLVAALMIVAIHTYPFEIINNNLDYLITRVLFRIAVPLFFMITGYFLLPKALKHKEKIIDYLKKIIKLYFISIIIYLPINIYMDYFRKSNLLEIIKDLLMNGTFYHLWYFPALILGVTLVYIMIKKMNQKTISIIVFLLYLFGLLGDSYYGFTKNIFFLKDLYNLIFKLFSYTRNGLFYAPIFIYIGYILNNKPNKLSYQKNIILIFISTISLLIEGTLLYYLKIPKHTSMYLSLLPLSYLIFNLLINTKLTTNKKIRNIATLLYILHPLFIVVIRFCFKLVNLEAPLANNMFNYLIVSISTIIFSIIIINLKELLLSKKKKSH